MKRFTKLLVYLLITALAAASVPAVIAAPQTVTGSTQKLPNDFWKLSPLYEKAVKANDYNNVIIYGQKIIDLFNGMPQTAQILQIVAPRLDKIARAYEALGDYDNAVKAFTRYVPLAEKLGWKDGVNYAKSKIKALDFDIQLYTASKDTDKNKYTGALFEPKAGVYFGSTYDQDPRINNYKWDIAKQFFPKKNSAYLVYLHWDENAASYDRYFQDAKRNGMGVQLAWNIEDYRMDSVLRNIQSYRGYIEQTATYLRQLDIPVFLRFACEMNIKPNSKDSAAYIKAFQYVATTIRATAPNVAMVWSPNDISARDRTYEQYYPGDGYVDWVGISTYNYRYFQGIKDWKDQQDSIDSVYLTGDYVNPLAKIKPVIDLYGGRKPIMISETGVGHYAKLEKEDLTEWAKIQLKRLYIYGPMIYPQLKGIYYFNVDNSAVTPVNSYALYKNEQLNKLYNELTASSYFLTDIGGSAPFRYEKIADYRQTGLNISLMTYTIAPKVLKPTVQYKLDGRLYAVRTDLPYSIQLDMSKAASGAHELTVEVYDGSKKLRSKAYQVLVNNTGIQIRLK